MLIFEQSSQVWYPCSRYMTYYNSGFFYHAHQPYPQSYKTKHQRHQNTVYKFQRPTFPNATFNLHPCPSGSHFLTNAGWGCHGGEYKAWMIIDVDDKEEARRIVPPAFREETKIFRVERFRKVEFEDYFKVKPL